MEKIKVDEIDIIKSYVDDEISKLASYFKGELSIIKSDTKLIVICLFMYIIVISGFILYILNEISGLEKKIENDIQKEKVKISDDCKAYTRFKIKENENGKHSTVH